MHRKSSEPTSDDRAVYRMAAEHAGAELCTRGTWTCPCPACDTCRALTRGVQRAGFCQRCRRPLTKRRGAKYCSARCRVAACEARKRDKPSNALMPLFERSIVGKTSPGRENNLAAAPSAS